MHNMTLEQLRATHEMGGIADVTHEAHGKGFYLVAHSRAGGRVVLVRYSDRKPRVFVEPNTALKMLREIGLNTAKVNMAGWQPDQLKSAV